MERTITLEDITNIVEAYDCFDAIMDALDQICDIDEYSGKLQGRYELLAIMKRHTVLDTRDRENDPYNPFRVTVENRRIPAKERAKLILGLQ
ncbi:MAG: hypothetical protein E7307_01410 [Butyrivibrio sp.]|nr:hypothetical protein [Butyrivibrio sp.]